VSADWRRLSRAARLHTEGDAVVVKLPPERSQRVLVAVDSDERGFSLTSRVAPPRTVHRLMPHLLDRIREQNRLSELVGYRIDRKHRLVGECWVPAAGLDAEEWSFYVRTLAAACDRLEFVLTGGDTARAGAGARMIRPNTQPEQRCAKTHEIGAISYGRFSTSMPSFGSDANVLHRIRERAA
jgi:hypothetical protein